jgi:mannose-6-phosphate isomerase
MKLKTHLVEKPWGRSDIPSEFGVPNDRKIGEIWFDDGKAEPLPLLIKWLFTSEKLSVQVHPSHTEARARGQGSGKEECWYVVDAQPGAVIGLGTKRKMSAAQLRSASLDGSVEQDLDWRPVKAGDYFYIAAGTVHAIGAGITLVEVQEYADITYRLYDYGRLDNGKARELHLDDGVAVAKAIPYSDVRSGNAVKSRELVNGPSFRLALITDAAQLDALPSDRARWLTPISGTINVGNETGSIGDCFLAETEMPVTMGPTAKLLWACIV